MTPLRQRMIEDTKLHGFSKPTQETYLNALEFMRRFLQHVLPKGFRKARCYGFLHPCSKKVVKLLQRILRFNPVRMFKKLKQRAKITCKCCGSKMKIICTMIPASHVKQTARFT